MKLEQQDGRYDENEGERIVFLDDQGSLKSQIGAGFLNPDSVATTLG